MGKGQGRATIQQVFGRNMKSSNTAPGVSRGTKIVQKPVQNTK